jgi:hypothetical protein
MKSIILVLAIIGIVLVDAAYEQFFRPTPGAIKNLSPADLAEMATLQKEYKNLF